MNRLIIIGNGFDLAHGIKSSFKDFITDYFCNAINSFYDNDSYVDSLFEIKFKVENGYYSEKPKPATETDVYTILNFIEKSNNFDLKFHSPLLQKAYAKIKELNWVDLEIEFFNVLLATKNANQLPIQILAIKKVNDQLDFLKNKLIEYLRNQQLQYSNLFDKSSLINCFCEKIYKHEIVTTTLEKDKYPDNLYFLNFNYTNTFKDYLSDCNVKSDFNFIHGSLEGVHGKPIFGFGDEFDKKYVEFENEKNKELFKHIKSFEYLRTKNYYLLTRFIDSNDFQVHIYGHSCGISDRTMLNQIFEHENCKSIKIFYYKVDEEINDFTDKTYEISRHFKDKGMLRKKLVPFDLSREMPQPKKY